MIRIVFSTNKSNYIDSPNFEFNFIKNCINSIVCEVYNSKGDKYKCIFREDNSMFEELLKVVILSFENNFFHTYFFEPLLTGSYSDLLSSSHEVKSVGYSNSFKKGSHSDKELLTKKLQRTESFRDKEFHSDIDMHLFLEFFSDFCSNLLDNMPPLLCCILKLLSDSCQKVFTIPNDNTCYPLFIFIFFKFLCNPVYQSNFKFPSKSMSSKKVMQLTKLLINITSNTLFPSQDGYMMSQFNDIINSCHKKLINIMENNILSLQEEELHQAFQQVPKDLRMTKSIFLMDCNFVLFYLAGSINKPCFYAEGKNYFYK